METLAKLLLAIAACVLGVLGLVFAWVLVLSATDGDRVNYSIVDTRIDRNGLVVELAQIEEQLAGSVRYGVYVYDTVDENLKYSEFKPSVVYFAKNGPEPRVLAHDGSCYVVIADYVLEGGYDREWKEPLGNRSLCFEMRRPP